MAPLANRLCKYGDLVSAEDSSHYDCFILTTSWTRSFHWAVKVVKDRWNVCGRFGISSSEFEQIVDVEFLHFFVPHAAMYHLVDENIYVLRYPDP